MAGKIFGQENAAVTLQDNSSSNLTNGSGVALATAVLDNRSGGNSGATTLENFFAHFRLIGKSGAAAWGSAPTLGKPLDVYLVPALDGTNYSTVTSSIPDQNFYVGSFHVQTVANSSSSPNPEYMDLPNIPLQPLLYKVYIVNNVGQTLQAGWQATVVCTAEQYS